MVFPQPTKTKETVQDIQIGAVEIKNSTTDDRLIVTATGDAQVTLDGENVDIGDISAGTQTNDVNVQEQGTPTVKPNALEKLSVTAYSVDTTAVQIFDASANANAVTVKITNAGEKVIYIYWTNSVSGTLFIHRLYEGESWEFPLGYTSDATNDLYAKRASAQLNDDVIVTVFGEV